MSVKYDFTGKRVLVTGAARGLGRAIVEKFLAAGATVFALDCNAAQLQELKKTFPSLETIPVDLLDWDESKKKVEAVAPIHHLVNNAGIAVATHFKNMAPENINRSFDVNFAALINMGQAMAKGLSEQNPPIGGTIVNISSIMDSIALQGVGLYSCTKAAVTMLTKVMTLELASQNIRVNAVRPTVMATELIDKSTPEDKQMAEDVVNLCLGRQVNKRILTVQETANVVLYLSSDASEMINGANILIDGGFYSD